MYVCACMCMYICVNVNVYVHKKRTHATGIIVIVYNVTLHSRPLSNTGWQNINTQTLYCSENESYQSRR